MFRLKKTRKESLRAIEHLEAERELMRSTHAKELEDIKKNESDALDTAKEVRAARTGHFCHPYRSLTVMVLWRGKMDDAL